MSGDESEYVVSPEQQTRLLRKLASRRFIITLITIVVSSLLIMKGKVEASTYENIMIWVTGIYIIGKPFGDRVSEFLNRINK